MKLAIVCTLMKRFGAKGFYNSQEIGLGRALAAMGHTVVIYKGVKDKSQVESAVLGERLTIHYMDIPHFVAHGYMPTRLMDTDFDGVFCFSDQQIFIPHVVRFCRKHHMVFVPYVGTTYSLYVNTLRGKIMDTLFAHTTLPVYRRMPLLAKTEAAKKELEALGVRTPVTVSPVGIDATVLKQDFREQDRAALRRELGFEEDDVILCNVARLEPDKRTLDLLRLFRDVRGRKKFRLLIVGDGPLRPEIDAFVRENGLENEVHIFKKVPYVDMWKIYTVSDYYLNMSRTEIFGMAIMEAVYYMTSVAAIQALGPSITLRDMPGHVLCETDEEMARWICGPYPAAETLAESSQKMIRDFSWQRTAREFVRQIETQRG